LNFYFFISVPQNRYSKQSPVSVFPLLANPVSVLASKPVFGIGIENWSESRYSDPVLANPVSVLASIPVFGIGIENWSESRDPGTGTPFARYSNFYMYTIYNLAPKKSKSGILPPFLPKSGIEPENPNPTHDS
jgi:hypothetical protein